VPLLGKSKEETPALHPLLEAPVLRPQKLTQELLDWCITALTAVLGTEQVRCVYDSRNALALRDALKRLDHLYDLTFTKEEEEQ
jgi:hypothetical protein